MAANANADLFNFLPRIYTILKGIEEGQDITLRVKDFKQQLEKAKAHVNSLPGCDRTPEDQLAHEKQLQDQITLKELEKDLHPIFKAEPSDLWDKVYKKVKLATEEHEYCGWVYTVDPVTHNWVLFVCDETLIGKLQIVMNSAVISYEVLNASCPEYIKELMEMFGRTERTAEETNLDINAKRDSLCQWFGVNRIPVKRDGENLCIADGVLSILPPYTADSCVSSNEIILSRVRTLINNMPTAQSIDVL